MSSNVLADAARRALRTLLWQVVVVLALAVLATFIWTVRTGLSVLAGGGIGLIWTMYMAYILFKHSLNHGVHMTAATFVGGWLIKVALTVALLIAAFKSGAFVPPAVLAGVAGALIAYGVAQALLVARPKR